MERLAVVMPVYNESRSLRGVLLDWLDALGGIDADFRLHVYNDGSTDGSLETLRAVEREHPEAVAVHDKANTGHGPTLLGAYLDNSGADWIFQTDSDGEIRSRDFLPLWKRRARFDLILGRRRGRKQSAGRRLLSALSRTAVRALYGKGLYDVNSPFRLMRTGAFGPHFKRIPPGTFAPNVLLSGAACLERMRVLELPVDHHSRPRGTSAFDAGFGALAAAASKSFYQTLRYRTAA